VKKTSSRGRERAYAAGRPNVRSGTRLVVSALMVGLLVCFLALTGDWGGGAATALAATDPGAVSPAAGASEAGLSEAVALEAVAPTSTVDVDVVVFSTQTSGLAAVRELAVGAPHLRIALISAGNLLETPLAQGLGVEDARDIGRVKGGFYNEWRQAVIKSYTQRGLKPYNGGGRFVYEPEVSAQVLWSFVRGAKASNVLFFSGKVLAASDQEGGNYADVQVEGGGVVRFTTRYFIDASVEGDLARMLGASYRIGRHEAVYNDVAGVKPEYPGAANNYETAPQRFSPLLTLKVYTSAYAPRIASVVHPNYDPSTYAFLAPLNQRNVLAFKTSWTMTIAVLPNAKRELNQSWNDWPDVGLAYQWIFSPEKRGEIRRRVLEWSINRVRYLQEHGYPKVGIASVPQKLYVREGPRIVGLDTYTVADVQFGAARHSVAIGCYAEYDRHDAFFPTYVETTRYVRVPMETLMAEGHPDLLVSTAISTDYRAYSSAVRMEHTRAHVGGAAGAVIVVADRLRIAPDQVPYQEVRRLLLARGYRLDIG